MIDTDGLDEAAAEPTGEQGTGGREKSAGKDRPESEGLTRQEAERALPVLRRPPDILFEEPKVGLVRRLWLALVRKRLLVLWLFLPLATLAAVEVFTRPLSHEGRAVLEIAPGSTSDGTAVAGTEEPLLPRDLVRTQAEKLESRVVADGAVRRLTTDERAALEGDPEAGALSRVLAYAAELVAGLVGGPTPGESADLRAAQRIDRDLDVQLIADTRLLSVSFVAAEVDLATSTLDAVIESLQMVEQERWERVREGERQMVADRLDALRRQAVSAQRALDLFAAERGLEAGVVDGDRSPTGIDAEVAQAELELAARRSDFQAVRSIRPEDLPAHLSNDSISELSERRAALAGELAALSDRYGPAWPRVRTLKSDLAAVELLLEREQQAAIDRVRRRFEAAQARYRQLSAGQADDAEGDLAPDLAAELQTLRAEARLRREQYEQLQQDVELKTVNALLAPTVATVVDPPHAVPYQTWTDRWRTFAMATALALLASCLVALFIAWGDSSLAAASTAPRLLRLMPLGDVPRVRRSGRYDFPAAGRVWRRSPRRPLTVFDADSDGLEAQEAFRRIRTSVLLARPELPPKTLLVVSPRGGEGSSTVAVNLAAGLAETGARTVLVDLNLRRPALAELFETDNANGMSTYLAGGGSMSDGISPTDRADLFVLPAGPSPDNPAQLMSSKRAESGLELLREYFGFIVLDGSPALTYSDVLALGPQVDGAVLVARAGKTPAEDLRELRDLFVRLRIPILGLVVNGVG